MLLARWPGSFCWFDGTQKPHNIFGILISHIVISRQIWHQGTKLSAIPCNASPNRSNDFVIRPRADSSFPVWRDIRGNQQVPVRQWPLQPSSLIQLPWDITAARGPRRVTFLAATHCRQVPAPFDCSDRRFVLRNGFARVWRGHDESWRKFVVG